MEVLDFIKNNMYIVAVFGVFIVGSIVYSAMRMGKMKKGGQSFLDENPDAAKVYLSSKAAISSEIVQVFTVNGQAPAQFAQGKQMGFYLKPGISTVQISFTHQRPGVMSKNVTTTTGAVDKQLEVQANKSYLLGFNRKEEEFTFTEI